MRRFNLPDGFWRLWIALCILWVAGVYVQANWHEWQCMLRDCATAEHLFDDTSFLTEAFWGLLLIAFAPPVAALAMAGLAVWIGRGFRKAPVKPYGQTKLPVDPMSPGPRLITEPPADAHIVDREKPNGSSSGSRCLLRAEKISTTDRLLHR